MKEAKTTANLKEQKEKEASGFAETWTLGNGWCDQSQSYMNTLMAPGAFGVPMPPVTSGLVRPRQVGPCFNCLEMGHLKVQCPKRNTLHS